MARETDQEERDRKDQEKAEANAAHQERALVDDSIPVEEEKPKSRARAKSSKKTT